MRSSWEDRGGRLLAAQRGKSYSPPLLLSLCPGVLRTLVQGPLVKIDMGLSFICVPMRKMCLVNEF